MLFSLSLSVFRLVFFHFSIFAGFLLLEFCLISACLVSYAVLILWANLSLVFLYGAVMFLIVIIMFLKRKRVMT